MSLLTVVTNVCNETGFFAPATVVTNSDPAYARILVHVNAAVSELSSRADWRRTLSSFTISSGSSASVPADFQRLVPGGALRLSGSNQPIRSLSDEEWRLVANAGTTSQLFFRLYGAQIQLSRALTGGETVTVDYVTNTPVVNGATFKSAVTQDADMFVFPEGLLEKGAIWRVQRMNNLSYQDQLAEFEAQLLSDYEEDRGFRAPLKARQPNA